MILPEFALPVCRDDCGSSFSGKGMHFEREILEYELYILRIFLQHLLEERLKPRTVRSLIVAEDSDCYRRVFSPLEGHSRDVDSVHNVELDDFHNVTGFARQNKPAAFP